MHPLRWCVDRLRRLGCVLHGHDGTLTFVTNPDDGRTTVQMACSSCAFISPGLTPLYPGYRLRHAGDPRRHALGLRDTLRWAEDRGRIHQPSVRAWADRHGIGLRRSA